MKLCRFSPWTLIVLPVACANPPPAPAPVPAAAPATAAAAPTSAVPSKTTPAPQPTIAEIRLIVGHNVNPDARGRPSPIIVRIYELKSLSAFNGGDFFAIFDRDRQSLGPELVTRDELPLTPGSTRDVLKYLRAETRYVGVVAAFRDVDRARWRAATAVPLNQTVRIDVKLDQNDVSIAFR